MEEIYDTFDKLSMQYELIDIEFELPYELPEENTTWRVCEDGPSQEQPSIEYDAEGIPMGQTLQEIQQREKLIKDFLEKWGNEHPERRVYNEKLEDYINVKGISVIEAKEHSAKSYLSTRAVLMIEEVMKNALPAGRVSRKTEDSNQEKFLYMIVLVYRKEEIGTVKLTVGVRKRDKTKIEYGISVLKPGEPLIKKAPVKKKKKRRPRM